MSQGTRDPRKKPPHCCVPYPAKGEEGQPAPEKAPCPLGLPRDPKAHQLLQERGGALGSFWKYNDPLSYQDSLGSILVLKALSGLAPSLYRLFFQSSLPLPSPQVQPHCWGP